MIANSVVGSTRMGTKSKATVAVKYDAVPYAPLARSLAAFVNQQVMRAVLCRDATVICCGSLSERFWRFSVYTQLVVHKSAPER